MLVTAVAGDLGWAATAAPPATDPGHLVPDEVWAAIVAEAESPRPVTRGRALPDRTISAVAHGGLMAGGPRMGVIHSAETPLLAGYAYSIARNWFATKAAGTSATLMIDPGETIRLLPDNVVSYAVGAKANGWTVNVEQTGRAAFTRAQWLTAPGRAQMRRVAQYMVECRDRWGIPLRWATDAQIRAAAVAGGPRAGWCLHDDVRRVLGGTAHVDPGVPAYPKAELMALAVQLGAPATPPAPPPAPPTTGDDMPTELPAGTHDYVLAVRPSDRFLKLVKFQGPPAQVNMINAMVPSKSGDVDGVGLAGAFLLPRFHGPAWGIPEGATCVVVNYTSAEPISAVLF